MDDRLFSDTLTDVDTAPLVDDGKTHDFTIWHFWLVLVASFVLIVCLWNMF